MDGLPLTVDLKAKGRLSSSVGRASILGRKIASLARQPAFVLLWLAPIWVMIGLASLAIRLFSFKRLAGVFGRSLGATPFVPLIGPRQRLRAERLRTTIAIAARYAPFRSDCFPQAIIAQLLCRLFAIPSALHFGVSLDRAADAERTLAAHAWVVSGPVAISGGNVSFFRFAVVGCYLSPGSDPAAASG